MIINRNTCESELVLALSRYIGYTTGAYNIARIADISSYFTKKSSLYEIELSKIIQKGDSGIKSDYATGVINYCCALGFITRHTQGGRLAKLGVSSLGRAYCYACDRNLEDFKKFLMLYSILRNDGDIYLLLLSIMSDNPSLQGDKLHKKFLSETIKLRNRRIKWLRKVFPNHILRNKVADKILWVQKSLKERIPIKPKMDFARHHSTPRKGWAKEIGHINQHGEISKTGERILKSVVDENEYFWIGPPKECFEKLRIPKDLAKGPYSPVWNILRPNKEPCESTDLFINDVSDYMIKAYPYLRLLNYNQASLESVLPFIYYKESRSGVRLDENELFNRIFSLKRKKFALMSKRSSIFGHYQLRKTD